MTQQIKIKNYDIIQTTVQSDEQPFNCDQCNSLIDYGDTFYYLEHYFNFCSKKCLTTYYRNFKELN